ncbi:hypothetical protein AAC387_Pa02g1827 [Persea americana]
MLSNVNASAWMGEGEEEEGGGASWSRTSQKQDGLGLYSFKSLLEEGEAQDWYINTNSNPSQNGFQTIQNHQEINDIAFPSDPNQENVLFQHMDSSSSCSPSPVFNFDPSQPFFPPKNCLHSSSTSLLSAFSHNAFEGGFDLSGDSAGFLAGPSSNSSVFFNRGCGVLPVLGDLGSNAQMGALDFNSETHFPNTRLLPLSENAGFDSQGFWGFDGSAAGSAPLFQNRPKTLCPLESLPPVGAQPTLFQKRAALRQNSGENGRNSGLYCSVARGNLIRGERSSSSMERRDWEEDEEKKMIMINEENDLDDASMNYDSDDARTGSAKAEEENAKSLNADRSITGVDQKGKRKGLPAKNLMAERRRRKKLNDRLYMLRSVVPKISKMDRASILGDAVEYLKELLERINNLHNELESSPSSTSLSASTSFHPLTPTPLTLPSRVKEELCPSSLPSPNGQPARVEVRVREGRAVNIHMFCARRPGLLLSTIRAIDELGLDIQQAVISCFNGFALDVFRAEQCKEGADVLPEEIKAELLHSAGFHETMLLDH